MVVVVVAQLLGQFVQLLLHLVEVRNGVLHDLAQCLIRRRGRVLGQVSHAQAVTELEIADGGAVLAAEDAQQRRLALAIGAYQANAIAASDLEPCALNNVIDAEALADARTYYKRHCNIRWKKS